MELSDTHLNITSGLGPMSMELSPPPSSEDESSSSSSSPTYYYGEPQYPFCHMKFFDLSLMEFAALSFLAYLKKDSPAFHAFFEAAFDQSEWSIRHAPDPKHAGGRYVGR